MKKFVFWSAIHKNNCIALTEDLSTYAQGETFWKAMLNLCETLKEWIPSGTAEESDINKRLKMYYETGINMVELFVEKDGNRFAVKCANSRSFLKRAHFTRERNTSDDTPEIRMPVRTANAAGRLPRR